MMSATVIQSDTRFDDVEHHFRVFAGPGAGKTYWLIEHIQNVLGRSDRLTPASKIACISYTNVAVQNIMAKLGLSADRVEVSTIHSFLYRNVVKPYLHTLKDDDGNDLVDYTAVVGHNEHRPTIGCVKEWLGATGARFDLFGNKEATFAYLKRLAWKRDRGTGEWSLKSITWTEPVQYLPTTQLHLYKPVYWKRGVIDHEDVLYFAYRIMEENSYLRNFLSARFPYVFIDEFQDTNPVQTQVMKWLADSGSVVGVIGDEEQAIFGFQGAQYEDFRDFSLPGHRDYTILGNRRSTNRIIAFLNHVRGQKLQQTCVRNVEGQPAQILVGEIHEVVAHFREMIDESQEYAILARRNALVGRIRRLEGSDGDDVWKVLEGIDSDREWFLRHSIAACESANLGEYSFAIKTLLRGIRVKDMKLRLPFKYTGYVTETQRRGLAVTLLECLVNDYRQTIGEPLISVYRKLNDAVSESLDGLGLQDVRGGQFKNFAENTLFGDLCASVSLNEETRHIRTIHKAKGAEFKSVLVCFEQEDKLDHILNPGDAESKTRKEEKRISYVGISRAEDQLFLSVPALSTEREQQLTELGVTIIRCS